MQHLHFVVPALLAMIFGLIFSHQSKVGEKMNHIALGQPWDWFPTLASKGVWRYVAQFSSKDVWIWELFSALMHYLFALSLVHFRLMIAPTFFTKKRPSSDKNGALIFGGLLDHLCRTLWIVKNRLPQSFARQIVSASKENTGWMYIYIDRYHIIYKNIY